MKHTLRTFCMALATMGLAASSAWAGETVVTQKGKKFAPGQIEIKVGDTITFVNAEKRLRHNVYSKDAGFKYVRVKMQKPGDKNSIVVKNAGTFTIQCALHPKMKMTVKVSN